LRLGDCPAGASEVVRLVEGRFGVPYTRIRGIAYSKEREVCGCYTA
jgi:hypothetical protein